MSQITMTKTHPGGTAGVLEIGKTYTVGTDLSATLADALMRQGKAVAAGGTWAVPTPITAIAGGDQPLALGGPIITTDGILINPADSGRPAAGALFVPMTYIWQLAASCATAAFVTVSRTLDGVTAIIGTINVPAGGTGVDAFDREYGATYSWAANVAGVTVEIM